MKCFACVFGLAAIVAGCLSSAVHASSDLNHDPAQVIIGERLFLETRFAQAYAVQPGKVDPALEYTLTTGKPLRGPFAGKTMNCRACHMVDEHGSDAGMRTYADYARHSPIPARDDGAHFTTRNSMAMVGIAPTGRRNVVFHYDGQFNSMQDLVRGTLIGRNYGWLPSETSQGIKHIAQVIRHDDGKGKLAMEFGGSYRKILTGTAKEIPAGLRLPAAYRVDVARASDRQILDAVARLIAAYVNDLHFARDASSNYSGSPYDQFLRLNDLPLQPHGEECASSYASRLLQAVTALESPKFIRGAKHRFKYHQQAFVFGKQELAGMKLFFARGSDGRRGGNCVSCHAAPDFSDFSFHNTGVTQHDYDTRHGQGTFAKLQIPDLMARNSNFDRYLPATARHPNAVGYFRAAVESEKPGHVDLGLWNVFANPDYPAPQDKLLRIMCQQHPAEPCKANALLPYTIATFKTPVLRDLGHSNPYMHDGQFDTLDDVVRFYATTSALVKTHRLRNADRELDAINLQEQDIAPLVAFLRALNEDYD